MLVSKRDKALLVIGPEPPPMTGMEVATQALVAELRRASIPYLRVDTADPRDELVNRGTWTIHNIALAVEHLVRASREMFRRDVGGVYVPISQEFPALLRDLLFIALAHLARKPVVVHLHGGAFGEFYESRTRPTRWLIRTLVGRAAVGIVLTDRLRPALGCVLPSSKIFAVQNGIDLPKSNGLEHRNDEDSITALFLSSLFPSKGVLVFIQALSIARQTQPSLRGVIAGSWPSPEMKAEAEALIRQLSLEETVEFVGSVEGPEKTRVLQQADIFCLPSFYVPEGQPLVVIEAMAAGLPVVATAWRGIADTVVDGETGLLVDTPEPRLVAEKLAYLAGDRNERRSMAAAARARYEQFYTQRAFGDRMIRVLQPLLESSDKDPDAMKAAK